jgi:hypothetical protein
LKKHAGYLLLELEQEIHFMPKLPAQAIPPDKRPKEPPPPFESELPSGLLVKWRMPDPFAMVAFADYVPDPITAAVIDLLKAEKSYTDETDPLRHRHEANNIKGMYGLAGAMAVEPKIDSSLEYGENGTLGRREIGYQDIVALYLLFRFSTRQTPGASPRPAQSEQPADAAPDSQGVRDSAV